jgi:hypothetical protein
MAVPSSGPLKLWDTLWNQELGGSQGENSLHSASVYAGFSTPDALSDFYGWSDVELPSVTTYSSGATTYNSICARGNVNSTGNENPSRGFYFGTNSSAPTNNTKYTLSGTQGVGAFACRRTSLSYAVTYYWWAFACNSAGESVGNRCAAGTPYPPYSPTTTTDRSNETCAEWNHSPVYGAQTYCGHASSGYINPYSSAFVANCSVHGKECCLGNGGNIRPNTLYVNAINCIKACAQSQNSNFSARAQICKCYNCNCWGTMLTSGGSITVCRYKITAYTGGPSQGPHAAIGVCWTSDIRLKTNINYL